ncbi:MAG: hypothetical protein KIT25_23655 [Enhydrobacter sp.]|nr:MAG: hypothetical protein KIT25_23655 [Enhydrobacter sp.]
MNRALSPDGKLFVLNNIYRAVPTKGQARVNDGIDIKALLQEHFVLEREGRPAESITPRDLRDIIFWASFGQRR